MTFADLLDHSHNPVCAFVLAEIRKGRKWPEGFNVAVTKRMAVQCGYVE